MKTWVTSDLHLGHTNIQKFCPSTRSRFSNVDEMNETMVREWNELVSVEDKVFILGDVAFLPARRAVELLKEMNGTKILIEGNHDRKLVKDPAFRKCFSEIHQYLRYNYQGQLVIMFHFPIFDHDQAARGSIMLHGHRHGNPTNLAGRIMDVGFDATGKIVTLLDDIVRDMQSVTSMYHHEREKDL